MFLSRFFSWISNAKRFFRHLQVRLVRLFVIFCATGALLCLGKELTSVFVRFSRFCCLFAF